VPSVKPPRIKGQYPNKLKQVRKANYILQAQLAELCGGLAKKNPDIYTTVSATALSNLENGYHKPKPKTATTLADALNTNIEVLFPLGPEDMVHNPKGSTRIST
jgi:transcriptional regulator with XRE-family HTH domain